MDQQQALELITNHGALLTGHFVGTQNNGDGTGLHMPHYVDSRALITYPMVIGQLATSIAQLVMRYRPEVVVGLPIGAYTLGHSVALCLNTRYVMAEKQGSQVVVARPAFKRAIRERRVLIVEDTVSGGETLERAITGVRLAEGIPVAIGCLVDRGRVNPERFSMPYHPLIRLGNIVTVTREECLDNGQCSRGVPIDRRPGHGGDLEKLVLEGHFADVGYRFR